MEQKNILFNPFAQQTKEKPKIYKYAHEKAVEELNNKIDNMTEEELDELCERDYWDCVAHGEYD